MVNYRLKFLAEQVLIEVSGRLLSRQMLADGVRRTNILRPLAEDGGAQGEERGVAIYHARGPTPARFAHGQVIGDRQQFLDGELSPAVVFDLLFGQVFDQVLLIPAAERARPPYSGKLPKVAAYYHQHLEKPF